jgi:hypothetical protein
MMQAAVFEALGVLTVKSVRIPEIKKMMKYYSREGKLVGRRAFGNTTERVPTFDVIRFIYFNEKGRKKGELQCLQQKRLWRLHWR